MTLFPGFICSHGFLRLLKDKASQVELLPCAALHKHPKAVAENKPVYYGEVVVSKLKR